MAYVRPGQAQQPTAPDLDAKVNEVPMGPRSTRMATSDDGNHFAWTDAHTYRFYGVKAGTVYRVTLGL